MAGHDDNEAFEKATHPGPTRWEQYLAGTITADDWTDEELARGMLRGRDGAFHGRPSKTVPTELLTLQRSTLRQRAQAKVEEAVFDAIRYLNGVIDGTQQPDADRQRAAQATIDRVLGKAADRVEVAVAAAPRWVGVFEMIHRPIPEVEAGDVEEAEVIE